MNWTQFKQRYHKELSHVAGFEEKFVDLVLSQIPQLDPSDVIPQYHFKDSKGGNRYVDFMIINPTKNWLLPIELDGYAKMVGNGEEYHRFNDFLERQNAMIQQFGLVLRYTNKTMLNQPQTIIREIQQTLTKQSQDKSTKEIQEQHIKATIADYEAKIKQLQTKQSKRPKDNGDELLVMLSQMKQEIATLKTTQPTPVITHHPDPEPKTNWLIWILALLILSGLAFAFVKGLHKAPEPIVVTEPSYTPQVYEPAPQTNYVAPPEPVGVQKPVVANPPKPVVVEPTPTPKQEPITAPEPVQETTQTQNVCGTVVQAKAFKGGVHLNLDDPYPNQTMTLKVWKQSNLDEYVGKYVCTYGVVKTYKGKPYIDVNSLKGIKVQ